MKFLVITQIRLQAINAIGALAKQNPEFGLEARDLLLHMLHDDDDRVRIGSLEVASHILKEINLRVSESDKSNFIILGF